MPAYVSCYTHRAAILNSRVIAFDYRGTIFRLKDYRAKDRYPHNRDHRDRGVHPPLLLHVLPSGLHGIRHYGLLTNGSRADNLCLARALRCAKDHARGPGDPPAARTRPCRRSISRQRWHDSNAPQATPPADRRPSA